MTSIAFSKSQITKSEFDTLINKQLEKYSLTIEDVKNIPDWYYVYTFDSEKEYLEWKKFCVKELRKRFSLKASEQIFQSLDLNYGLRHAY